MLMASKLCAAGPHFKEGGVRAWAAKLLMSRVGATTPSADRITLLRDADGDGVAETKTTFAQGAAHGLKSPFGMTLVGETLYVANADGVVSFPYQPGQTSVTGAGTRVFDLPGGPPASGLNDATRRLEGVEGIAFSRFSTADVVRHPIVGRIVEAYEGPNA